MGRMLWNAVFWRHDTALYSWTLHSYGSLYKTKPINIPLLAAEGLVRLHPAEKVWEACGGWAENVADGGLPMLCRLWLHT